MLDLLTPDTKRCFAVYTPQGLVQLKKTGVELAGLWLVALEV